MSDAWVDQPTERLREAAYKAGFDTGVAYQKKADPPPKARELGKQLREQGEAWSRKERQYQADYGALRGKLRSVIALVETAFDEAVVRNVKRLLGELLEKVKEAAK